MPVITPQPSAAQPAYDHKPLINARQRDRSPHSLSDRIQSVHPTSDRLLRCAISPYDWYHRLRPLWCSNSQTMDPPDEQAELVDILAEGRSLRQAAEDLAVRAGEQADPVIPHGGTPNWVLAAGMLLLGASAGMAGAYAYHRYRYGPSQAPDSAGKAANNSPGVAALFLPQSLSPAPSTAPSGKRVINSPNKKCYQTKLLNGLLLVRQEIPCPRPPIIYEYTPDQPVPCNTRHFAKRCQKRHASMAQPVSRLVLLEKGQYCFCPPPPGNYHIRQPSISSFPLPGRKFRFPSKFRSLPRARPVSPVATAMIPYGKSAADMLAHRPASPIPVADIILRKRSLPAGGNKTGAADAPEETSEPEYQDDVRIEKLYDFSCIDERNNISWLDVLRQIGTTLREPIATLATETLVIYAQRNSRQACQTPEKSEYLQSITSKIDEVLTNTLTLLPGSHPLAIAQLLIGPAIEMLAADIAGEPANLAGMAALNQQLLFMLRPVISTLSGRELGAIYVLPEKPTANTDTNINPVNQRIALSHRSIYITIANKKYPLRESPTNAPYVEIDGYKKPVRFNQRTLRWEFAGQHVSLYDSEDSQKNKAVYGISLLRLAHTHKVRVQLDTHDKSVLQLQTGNGKAFPAVIVNDVLIPIARSQVNSESVITTPEIYPVKRVLYHTDYGWFFEAASVALDTYLGLLLNSRASGIAYTAGEHFTRIMPDGFCYNDAGNRFLKRNYNYYYVIKLPSSDQYTCFDYPGSVFINHNGLFSLLQAPGMLFSFRQVPAGLSTAGEATGITIEPDALRLLQLYGIPADGSPQYRVVPAIYADEHNNLLFSVAGKNYQVNHFSDRSVAVRREIDTQARRDIHFWRYQDAWLRVRDEDEKISYDYEELASCRSARSPKPTRKCLPVVLEKSLDKCLSEYIIEGKASNKSLIDKALVASTLFDIPAMYLDSGTLVRYFLYKGHLFETTIQEASAATNPSGHPLLNIYAKRSFFRRRNLLARVVVEKKSDKTELKQLATFLSEKTNTSKDIAQHYINSAPWQHLPDLRNLEEAINQLLLSGKAYVAPPVLNFQPTPTASALNTLLITTLFQPEPQAAHTYEIYGLQERPPQRAGHIRTAQNRIMANQRYITSFILPEVKSALKDFARSAAGKSARNYFSRLLNSDNPQLLADVAVSLAKRVTHIADTLRTDRIFLMSCNNEAAAEPVITYPPGKVAVVTPDASRRIFINIDKLSQPGELAETALGTDAVNFLLHEASHAGGMASDIVHIPREQGEYIPTADAIDHMIEVIQRSEVVDPGKFRRLTREYLQNVAVYHDKTEPLPDNPQLAYLAKNDPGYLAHLMLHSADMLALLIQELYEIITFDLLNPASFNDTGSKAELMRHYRRPENMMARGSIGTVYDLHNGYLVKDYRGTITPEYKSRLQAAINNVSAMNRLYGTGSATLLLHPESDGQATASVRMIKLPGQPLSSILTFSDPVELERYRFALEKQLTEDSRPAEQLAVRLSQAGLHHQDINEANLLFDIDKGFNLVDFDATDIRPPGEALSDQITRDMALKLTLLMQRLGRAVGLGEEAVLKAFPLPAGSGLQNG